MLSCDSQPIFMGSSYINVCVHIIFHTKNTSCSMRECDLSRIFHYIGGTIRSLSGYVCRVWGRPDHIHILTSLPPTLSIADFVRKIKSNSSKWIKNLHESYCNFSWQEGYGIFSVSESNKEMVIHYIEHQKEHHEKRSANEEFILFLKRNGILSTGKSTEDTSKK